MGTTDQNHPINAYSFLSTPSLRALSQPYVKDSKSSLEVPIPVLRLHSQNLCFNPSIEASIPDSRLYSSLQAYIPTSRSIPQPSGPYPSHQAHIQPHGSNPNLENQIPALRTQFHLALRLKSQPRDSKSSLKASGEATILESGLQSQIHG